MRFKTFYLKEKEEDEPEIDEPSPDDDWSFYSEPDDEFEFDDSDDEKNEKSLGERLIKKIVIRDGKKKIKWTSSREGFRVVKTDDNKISEIKIPPAEKRERQKSQKKAAIKRKGSLAQSQLKRKISLKKRKQFLNK